MGHCILSSGKISRQIGVLAGCALLLLAGAVRADDVTLTADHASGESWVTAAKWSNSKAAEAGHDYFAGADRSGSTTGMGKVVRTPQADSTFPGDSLNIKTGGTLALKCTGAGNKFTFGNLQINGGAMSQYQDNSTATVFGNVAFTGNCTISDNGANPRGYIFEAAISGAGKITMAIGSDDGIVYNSDSNTYSGEYVQNGSGPVYVKKAGALGLPTTYTLAQGCRLNVMAPVALPATLLQITSTAAVMNLGDNLSVQSLKVMGKTVKPGVYKASDMTTWPTQFVGAGTLAVGQTINPVRKAWLFN